MHSQKTLRVALRYPLTSIVLVAVLLNVTASASSFNIIESTFSVSGAARAFAASPSFYDSYSLSGSDPLFGHAQIGGGINEPSAKIESYAGEGTLGVQQHPRSSGANPYVVETYGSAETDLLFRPDFNGTGEDIIFSFLNGDRFRGGYVTITDMDSGLQLLHEDWGYNGIEGNGEFKFQFDAWNSDTHYLLSMGASAREYEQEIVTSMSSNMAFTSANVPDSTSTLALLGGVILGLALFRSRFVA